MRRSVLLYAAACFVACSIKAVAASEPRLVLMPPEIEGDLSDKHQAREWPRRLDLIAQATARALEDEHLYTLVDRTPAADLFEQYSHRAAVWQCVPCVVKVGERLEVDRVLSLRVFRMSHLVMILDAILRDAESGDVRYARHLSFRGDNDKAWLRAIEFLIEDIKKIPRDKR